MTWALRRRLIIIGIIAAVLAALLTVFYFTTIRQAPSCTDGKQNQDEEGIDCGGSCTYYCSSSQAAPSVRFVRAVSPVPGRTDIIAYLDNPNATSAARNLPFTVELYDAANVIVAKRAGTTDLPPASTVPVFIPNIQTGSAVVSRAFLTFTPPAHFWYRPQGVPTLPTVANVRLTESDMPRITATVSNTTVRDTQDQRFIATVFDAAGNAIAASQTVASIPARGTASLVFTWPAPFSGAVARVEVVPVPSLP